MKEKKIIVLKSSIYLISNLINALTPFILIPILTRYLSTSEYGKIAIFQTFISVFGAIAGLNLAGATARKYYDRHDKHTLGLYISSALQILAVSATSFFCLIFLVKDTISDWANIEVHWVLWAIVVAFSNSIIAIRLAQWQVREKAYQYAIFQLSSSSLNLATSLVFVILLDYAGDGRIMSQIFTFTVFSIASLYFLKRENLLAQFTWSTQNNRELLLFGVPLVPHVLGTYLLIASDRLIISKVVGLGAVGVYAVAFQVSLGLYIIFDAFNKAISPWLFKKLKDDDSIQKKKIIKYTYFGMIIIVIVTVILASISKHMIHFLAGERYSKAGDILFWLFIGQGFSGLYLMVTNYIFFSKKTGYLSLVTVTTFLLHILFLLILTKQYGIIGTAISFCISMAVKFILTWIAAQKCHPMPWFQSK